MDDEPKFRFPPDRIRTAQKNMSDEVSHICVTKHGSVPFGYTTAFRTEARALTKTMSSSVPLNALKFPMWAVPGCSWW